MSSNICVKATFFRQYTLLKYIYRKGLATVSCKDSYNCFKSSNDKAAFANPPNNHSVFM